MKKKNIKRTYYVVNLICIFVLILTLLLVNFFDNIFKKNSTDALIKEASSNNILNEELKAVWVPFMDLDMKGSNYTEKEFKEKFDTIVNNCKDLGMNTLIVHTRPFGDALYKSEYFPSSHIVAGEQGKELNFDPLKYMVDASHKENLKIHAWVNPFRIQKNNCPEHLADSNLFTVWKNSEQEEQRDFVVALDHEKLYNPGYSQVRALIIKGVEEIVKNYDVDGIHFDDYFYPKNEPDFDKKCYEEYLKKMPDGEALPQEKWRTANINSLISGVYSAIKNIKPSVEFGISPQCNLNNNDMIGADVRSWCQMSGYIDYICPQAYVNFENPILPFDKALKDWVGIVDRKNVRLYYGLGLYKIGSKMDNGTWEHSENILQREVELARATGGADGFVLFSYSSLIDPKCQNEVTNVLKALKDENREGGIPN
ncbi:MAG: family 10 glycosylhydrolase [Clostridia bacterium]|nr:family 10 glycosylhydrolase [Clostridia bacterium]